MISGNSVSYSFQEFHEKTIENIVGELKIKDMQIVAWEKEIEQLHEEFKFLYNTKGRIIFEYGIPGLSKVIDVIVLLADKIFVIEYKVGKEEFLQGDIRQTLGYALRLKYFHSKSKDRQIVPILIATEANAEICENPQKMMDDGVYEIVRFNGKDFKTIFDSYIEIKDDTEWQEEWEKGIFKASPDIISAAKEVWNEKQQVNGLTDSNSNDRNRRERLLAEEKIHEIIEHTKNKKRKALIFVTGVPGAGKTLVGLNVSVKEQDYGASLLSGNGPLVEVLTVALRRNLDKHYNMLSSAVRKDIESASKTKQDAAKDKVAVDAIIRGVYAYKNEIIERLDYKNQNYVIKDGQEKSSQHIIIYDEAQRAWSVDKMRRPGRSVKEWQTTEWDFSEPALLLWDMDKLDWGVFICLVGGGQEINEGESGINEWLRTIIEDKDKVNLTNWDIYMAPDLQSKEYQIIDGQNKTMNDYIEVIKSSYPNILMEPISCLHLTECQRSPLSTRLSEFINKLVEGVASKEDYAQIKNNYPIKLTRDIRAAKNYIRKRQKELTPLLKNDNAAEDEQLIRGGMLMSSSALRLRPLGFDIKKVGDYIHKTPSWFLDSPKDNIDSSDFLEIALNEFFVQGLEIDLGCVIWDADFRYHLPQKNQKEGCWKFFKFNKKSWSEKKEVKETGRTEKSINSKKEQNIKIRITQTYMRNAYRVLLTRSRYGMVICVPEGDINDDTRKPEYYDGTYNYLKSLGLDILS